MPLTRRRFAAILPAAGLTLLGSRSLGTSPDDPATITLLMAGDVMLADLPGETVAKGGDPFRHFADVLERADVTVANLECAVATTGEKVDKSWNFRAHPRVLPLIKRYFDAVSLANNHSGDYGPEALEETIERLDGSGVPHFGAGRTLAEAHRPFVFERQGIKVAILGYDEFRPKAFEAKPDAPGVAWSHGVDYEARVLEDIRAAKTKADLVIPLMHWGREESPANDRQKTFARRMIDAGADVVVGGHPHVTQGVDSYKGKLIVYSLGNFVFDDYEGRAGWLLRLTLSKQGVERWETLVATTDASGTPHPTPDPDSPRGRAVDGKIVTR